MATTTILPMHLLQLTLKLKSPRRSTLKHAIEVRIASNK